MNNSQNQPNNASVQNASTQNAQNAQVQVEKPKNLSLKDCLEFMSPDQRAIAEEGERLRTDKLQTLRTKILKAPDNKFTEQMLSKFDTSELEAIAGLIKDAPAPTNNSENANNANNGNNANNNGNNQNGANQNANANDQRNDRANFRGNNANAGENGDNSHSNLRNQAAPNGGSGNNDTDESREVKPINITERFKAAGATGTSNGRPTGAQR